MYTILFSPESRLYLKKFSKREQVIILDEIAGQLVEHPDLETRHRKHLRPNPLAPWELRIGDFRVFYDVEEKDSRVIIVAVGQKHHDRLVIGNEEVIL